MVRDTVDELGVVDMYALDVETSLDLVLSVSRYGMAFGRQERGRDFDFGKDG